jgi:hypothetical protein
MGTCCTRAAVSGVRDKEVTSAEASSPRGFVATAYLCTPYGVHHYMDVSGEEFSSGLLLRRDTLNN